MKKQPKETISNPSDGEYKTPISITLCYLFGIIGLFVGVILIIRGFNINPSDGYIGGGFLGGSIMLFTLYYIASDIHFIAWNTEKKREKDEAYQSFVLRHLQNLDKQLPAEENTSSPKPTHNQYMDL